MDSSGWDARYSSHELVWGNEPNRFVAEELASHEKYLDALEKDAHGTSVWRKLPSAS